jgi:hypothetical protein
VHAVLAHGALGRSQLPLSLWVLAYLAAATVALAAMVLAARRPRIDPVGQVVDPLVDRVDRSIGLVARVLGAATVATVVIAAFAGDRGRTSTPNIVLYITLWVGLPLAMLVAGDLLRPPAPLLAPTHWPAALGLFTFVWLELAWDDPSSSHAIGAAVVVYLVVVALCVRRWGRRWLRTGEAFGVWLTFVASLAPLHRADGRLHVRAPVVGLRQVETRPGTRAVLAVVVGSVIFDVLTRADRWHTPQRTVVLLGCIALVALAATAVPAMDTAALIPVAVAWLLTLYLSLLLVEGQTMLAAVSDPFGRGWDLFGTANRDVDFGLFPDRFITAAQLALLALGHAAGTVVATTRRTTIALGVFALAGVVVLLGR